MDKVCVFNRTRQSFLSLAVTVADTYVLRLVGLLGRRRLKSGEGLWVCPSQGIHTIGMLFPIDVIYLDEHKRVIDLVENLGTFRIGPVRMQCRSVLELPTRTIFTSLTQIGDELVICSPDEMEIHWKAQQVTQSAKSASFPEQREELRWRSTKD